MVDPAANAEQDWRKNIWQASQNLQFTDMNLIGAKRERHIPELAEGRLCRSGVGGGGWRGGGLVLPQDAGEATAGGWCRQRASHWGVCARQRRRLLEAIPTNEFRVSHLPEERGRMGHPLLFCCWCFAKSRSRSFAALTPLRGAPSCSARDDNSDLKYAGLKPHAPSKPAR